MTPAPVARIYRSTPRNLARLARCLREGELVAVPTETVYGLAGNAFDPQACAKIFRAKNRPHADPLIVHLHSLAQLPLVCHPNSAALKLARRFWPGPLTMILPKTDMVPGIVSAGRPSVAVRIPRHPVFRRLLKLSGLPLAAPSANPFGYVSPTTAEHVRAGLGKNIRYILDGGPSRIGLESTIVDLRESDRPCVLRPGAITRADIERVLGCSVTVARRTRSSHKTPRAQVAPGLLARHYSPRTAVVLHEKLGLPQDQSDGYIFFRRPREARPRANVFWLDPKGSLSGAARKLFAILREADAAGFKRIHVELAPGDGLAVAINDRLRRAAAR